MEGNVGVFLGATNSLAVEMFSGCLGEEVRPVACFGILDGLEESQPGLLHDEYAVVNIDLLGPPGRLVEMFTEGGQKAGPPRFGP